jgi:outer membrane lipoprotein-sorting protein
MRKVVVFFTFCILSFSGVVAQDINLLLQKVKQKIALVKDYEASGKMKTNVTFLKVPVANVKVYFKNPNKLKVKSEKGLSFIPKGAVSINMNNVLSNGNYTVIDAGTEQIGITTVRVAKLLPEDDNSDVVLSTVYIDAATNLIRRAKTTTKENGSYELEMTYGKYANFSLPDKIIFTFNTKDYKLPKGVTFDFDDGSKPAPAADKGKNKKGKAEITFSSYTINKGIAESIFL